MTNNTLPISIKLLFENKYLEYIDILCVLYIFKRRKKGINYEELLYWLTLLNSVKLKNKEFNLDKMFLQNNYLNYDQKLKIDIRILVNQGLVWIEIDKLDKKNSMYFKILDAGIKLVNELENIYFDQQIKKINYLKKFMPYSLRNEKGVLENK
ncbi:hypothetical protein [Anaerosinus gibii]|uniref:Uncharacterized protein n=1 Tax=Selenobaculum gibii TaxID=3054208 RepID=A0A9Y2AHY3_9FIRM|nr:hypothetical protein [Selenobaculum gbiensis]WIW70283.1 hypothetical protein P3F81_10340 [Selenobaculum gbiensis]